MCLATVLAGCEGPPARARAWHPEPEPAPRAAETARPPAATPAEDPRFLRIRLAAEPSSLDPLGDPDREALEAVEDTVFEPLVRHTASGLTPGLAESFRVAGGGSEIRFTLRQGVVFHDGHPFTAVDAQFSIDAARRRPGRLHTVLADLVAVEIWGPRDLRVTLRRPDGYALRALAEVPIVPAALYATEAGRVAHLRAPVGTGPFRFVRWAGGDRIVLARFPDYWGVPAALEGVELIVVPDGARALSMARAGRLDVLPALIPAHWPQAAGAPDVVERLAPLELRPARFVAAVLNLRRPPFADPRVREAAALLVDRMKLARDGWHGLARAAGGPVFPGGPGDADGPPPPLFDPLRAGLLLDQAGWIRDPDGLRAQGGKKLKITMLGAGASADPEREPMLAALRRGGFLVELRTVPADDFFARLKAGDFDLALVDYRGRVDEDLAPFFATGGARNWGGLSSPVVDGALFDAAQPWEPAARAPLVAALGRAVAAEWPLIPLVVPTPHGLIARRLGNIIIHDGWLSIRDIVVR